LSDIGETDKELVSLSKRDSLPDADLQRAKELMKKLRRLGFTNQNVSSLVKGRCRSHHQRLIKFCIVGEKFRNRLKRYEVMTEIVPELINLRIMGLQRKQTERDQP